jgi:SAM-dependent methyltransferase
MSADAERIGRHYDALVKRFGPSAQSADASTMEGLTVRYEALCGVLDLDGFDVLEAGCGVGLLGEHIRTAFPRARYRGIDVSEEAIRAGKRAHPDLDLACRDLMELEDADAADVVLAQGIFYLLGDDAEEKTHRLIEQMWSLARVAVAFSAISSWGTRDPGGEFLVDPSSLVRFCKPAD